MTLQKYDGPYHEKRLAKSCELATSATMPSIREIHLKHAAFYEHVLLDTEESDRAKARRVEWLV